MAGLVYRPNTKEVKKDNPGLKVEIDVQWIEVNIDKLDGPFINCQNIRRSWVNVQDGEMDKIFITPNLFSKFRFEEERSRWKEGEWRKVCFWEDFF